MVSSYSTSLRLELMATGDQSGTWGTTTNTNLGTLLEQAITGYAAIAMADSNQTLSTNNGATDEARNMVIESTGALTAARQVIVPTVEKVYLFKNSTTGGFAVTIKTSAGSGVAVAMGDSRWVYCDGTDVVTGPEFLSYGAAQALTTAQQGQARANINVAEDNLLFGAWPVTAPWTYGTSITAATTPANSDDTYIMNRWVLISDGNDIVDISQDSDGSALFTVQTANKQFGLVQIVEADNCADIIGDVVSIAARVKASGLATFRMAVLSWTGTADSVTSDVVATWAGGGTEPTWAANWTREGSVTDITTTTSFATTKGDNISVDTSSTKQIAFVIWLDDTDGAGSDTFNFEWLSVVKGAAHPDEPRFRSEGEESILCARYLPAFVYSSTSYVGVGQAAASSVAYVTLPIPVRPRTPPTGVTTLGGGGWSCQNAGFGSAATFSRAFSNADNHQITFLLTSGSGLVAGDATMVTNTGANTILCTGCEL